MKAYPTERYERVGMDAARWAPALAVALCMPGPALAEESPYRFEFVYTLDALGVQSGGLKEGSAFMDNLDLMLTVDAERAWGLRNGTVFLYALSNHGGDINADNVGSAQGVDNIEADDAVKLYEAWYEQAFERSTLRAGLYDLNSEFDSIDTAGLFINPSHGIGPDYSQSGQNGPSIFPTTSLAIRFATALGEQGYMQAAVLDGVPGDPSNPRGTHIRFDDGDGALIAVEGGVRDPDEAGAHWGIGAWHYTEDSSENATGNPISPTPNQGLYAFAEHGFGNGLSVFGRAGVADEKINQVVSYLGAGLIWSGMGGRADDHVGLAVAVANMSSDYSDATGSDDREVIWELTYRSQINEWFAVQPDVQYVQDPGADPAIGDALVLGVRFEIAF